MMIDSTLDRRESKSRYTSTETEAISEASRAGSSDWSRADRRERGEDGKNERVGKHQCYITRRPTRKDQPERSVPQLSSPINQSTPVKPGSHSGHNGYGPTSPRVHMTYVCAYVRMCMCLRHVGTETQRSNRCICPGTAPPNPNASMRVTHDEPLLNQARGKIGSHNSRIRGIEVMQERVNIQVIEYIMTRIT